MQWNTGIINTENVCHLGTQIFCFRTCLLSNCSMVFERSTCKSTFTYFWQVPRWVSYFTMLGKVSPQLAQLTPPAGELGGPAAAGGGGTTSCGKSSSLGPEVIFCLTEWFSELGSVNVEVLAAVSESLSLAMFASFAFSSAPSGLSHLVSVFSLGAVLGSCFPPTLKSSSGMQTFLWAMYSTRLAKPAPHCPHVRLSNSEPNLLGLVFSLSSEPGPSFSVSLTWKLRDNLIRSS